MKVKEARCSNCEALAAQVADLQARVELLTEQVETLKEQLAKGKGFVHLLETAVERYCQAEKAQGQRQRWPWEAAARRTAGASEA